MGAGFLAGSAARTDDKKAEPVTVKPVPRNAKWWTDRHDKFLKRAKEGNVDVLFLGDSITEGWAGNGKNVWKETYEPLHAANFGIGGDRTEHVLWRIKDGKELDGIHPKAVVLMIGTNNMGSNSAADIAKGVEAIVHELSHQLPHGKVLVLGIFPRSAKATDGVREKIKNANKDIAKLDDSKNIRYLDIGDKFLDSEGNLSKDIMPDYLHLSAKGYKIWADSIQTSLDEMLKKE
jgi:lysophospholipase L1-like esterase